jgi:hypothetical protein
MALAERWLLAILLAAASAWVAAEPSHGMPSVPTIAHVPIPDAAATMGMPNGDYEWLASRTINPYAPEGCRRGRIVFTRWRPATAGTLEWPMPWLGNVQSQARLPAGIFFVATYGDDHCSPDRKTEIGLYTGHDNPALLILDHRIPDADLRVVPLSDSSVALVGQNPDTREIVVHVARYDHGRLQVERMPDLGIAHRDGFALTTLDENRLMVLGGASMQFNGATAWHAETYVLDVKTRAWHPGPAMREGRARAAAVRMPDGGILVTGGLTSEGRPSRTTEQWKPSTDTFAPAGLMATANAYHRPVWLTLDGQPTLLLAGGINAGAQALDAATGTWRVVATWPGVTPDGSCTFFPFAVDGHVYAWNMKEAGDVDHRDNCVGYKNSILASLMPRIESFATATAPAGDSLVSYQSEAAFLPAGQERPALIIGGTVAGADYASTSRVTGGIAAIDTQGRMLSMPSLAEPRRKAQAFRIDGGVIVVGGTNVDDRDLDKAKTLPMEWLDLSDPQHPGAWQKADGEGVALNSTVGPLANGHLLEMDTRGSVNEIELVHNGASLGLKRTPWPAMNMTRVSGLNARVQTRSLPDGRVIVAGGGARDKIALWKSDSDQPDAADEYISIGETRSSADYEIFDPVTRRWNRSASSAFAGEAMAIGDDGRVWKFGKSGSADAHDRQWRAEVSSADGTTWTPLSVEASPNIAWDEQARIFALDGEIFAAGQRRDTDKSQVSTTVWFNTTRGKWEPLRTDTGEEWRGESGQFLVAHLPTGKIIVVPGGGL